jgi:hypothetical protein
MLIAHCLALPHLLGLALSQATQISSCEVGLAEVIRYRTEDQLPKNGVLSKVPIGEVNPGNLPRC